MKTFSILLTLLIVQSNLWAQDYYDLARAHFHDDQLDSARYYININLSKNPGAEDYFLSAMIHEAENKDLRALADYEAVIKYEPNNLEAYFQKGLIYYNSASTEQAIRDFTFVLENQQGSETKAVYYGSDPTGAKGTFLTTLQSMISRVYQYRGMAYQKLGDWDNALKDFTSAFEYDTIADCFINRSQLYSKMGNDQAAIADLKAALRIDSTNYHAWYNLAILDESTQLPLFLLNDQEFTPMLNLVGANAYESGEYGLAAKYHTKAIEANPEDDLAYLSRGKALLRTGAYGQARQDFIKALQLNPARSEAFHLIGNTLFHEKKYKDAVGFYERYLSVDRGYKNVWFNTAMAYLSMNENDKGCEYLQKADELGMGQASELMEKHCGSQ
ncbi:Tetratricopeptide repeat-containing protein [Ekhidna lutea]|uniref:Tetratricopeptide repeat-containing protein n=1 Tax=Ekhidna lutea TaxID=447679 RepID=A0A239JQN6_EKHLU|nr:tetratricopeptide repeat protein [Ekhidna lutea]SNT07084.1 Tetratricopeptide repeat-containing protein [Ekhidna lutea]